MSAINWKQYFILAFIFLGTMAQAGDWKINLPRRSKSTPVQQLNREGVEAVKKHEIEKAKSLFYRAYLLDPDDPFTLNNLGYISELEGQAERAQTYYSLASRTRSDAVVDRASSPQVEGQLFSTAMTGTQNTSVQVNRANLAATILLSQRRVSEAETLLQQAFLLDQKNPFTLNNLGVTKEMEGDFNGALAYYRAAADVHSAQAVVLAQGGESGGKPVSEVAATAAKRLIERMNTLETPNEQASLLNLRGVYALNRNDLQAASKDFIEAYKLDPNDAFSLNNAGYVAELEGDLESAQIFYERARAAREANAKVGLASRRSAEGAKLVEVADESNQHVSSRIDEISASRRMETGPIVLKRRDGTPVDMTPPAEQHPPTQPTNEPH